MNQEKYMLFIYYDYYPSGGMNDFVGGYSSASDALSRASREGSWGVNFQVVDRDTWEILARGKCDSIV